MATLILGAVGTFIGGPIGGLIGSAIGQSIDGAIFGGGQKTEGPRLKELDLQTSDYGHNIPAIFGAVRVAGSVIWATDLAEQKTTHSNGKGKPKTVEYSYSVNMAVALSCRPIGRVGRIWAEGNLLRGAEGDFKSNTGFRFYNGHDDQPLDPLMASAETIGKCPAFRGLSYVVFEDFQLADYGNRIPSLTFELFEREGDVPLLDIASYASQGNIIGASGETVSGYALEGTDGRAALAPLLNNMPVLLRPDSTSLNLHDWWSDALVSSSATIADQSDNTRLERPQRRRDPSGKLAQALALRHYDPARDYQTGVQRSQFSDTGRVASQIDLPVTMRSDAARRLADLQLLQAHCTREQWTGHAVIDENRLIAGDWLQDPHGDGYWQIVEIEHLLGALKISTRRSVLADPDKSYVTDAGRNLAAPDTQAGHTVLALVDLPALNATDSGQPLLAIAAAGDTVFWRSAALALQSSTGLIEQGITAAPATMGHVIGVLPPHSPYLVDEQHQLLIELLNGAMEIPAASDNPLYFNASSFWVGGEIIQAGQVQYVGDNRYLLSRIIRGCFGTEHRIAWHQTSEQIILLENETLRFLDSSLAMVGTTITLEASGIGDITPATAAMLVTGNAVRPRSPIHGFARLSGSQDIVVGWTRRTRIDPGWNDGVDVPLAEDNEQYSVTISCAETQLLSETVLTNQFMLSPAMLQNWNLPPASTLIFEVRQIGRYAVSIALSIHLILP
jgi:Putative phage tail protein